SRTFQLTDESWPNICCIKALTVSSVGKRALNVGSGGAAFLLSGGDFCCAGRSEASKCTINEQSDQRCMYPFLSTLKLLLFAPQRLKAAFMANYLSLRLKLCATHHQLFAM